MPPPAETYLALQGAFEAALRRQATARELGALGRLCDAAWEELCSARRAERGHDTAVIAETPLKQGIPRSARETATRMS